MSDLQLLTPWTAEIILAIDEQSRGFQLVPVRFNRLAEAIPGISDRILGVRLQQLCAAGLAERVAIMPEYVTHGYLLTKAGERLVGPLKALRTATA